MTTEKEETVNGLAKMSELKIASTSPSKSGKREDYLGKNKIL
jgi:hypothetical protein